MTPGFSVASHIRAGVLRRGDDAYRRSQIRHGQVTRTGHPQWTVPPCPRVQVRHRLPRLPAPGRRDHRGGHADQQDGARLQEGLRPDARAAVGGQHGQLRQRGRLLPLQLRRGQGLRQNRPGKIHQHLDITGHEASSKPLSQVNRYIA